MSPRLTRRPKGARDTQVHGPLKGVFELPESPLKELHKWADYVELRCASSADGAISLGDVGAWFRLDPTDAPDGGDADATDADADDYVIVQDVDHPESPDLEDEPRDAESVGQSATSTDNRQRLAEDTFRVVAFRSLSYGDAYPFVMNENSQTLSMSPELSASQHLYLFLLLCSLGRYVARHGQLAKDFERLCVPLFEQIVPSAEIYIFGTAADGGNRFTGNLRSNLTELATMLGEYTTPYVDGISQDENGDRGLDVVGVVTMGDTLGGKLVVYGQAACTDEWITKQDSPSNDAWDRLIPLTNPAVVACCIPHCFRDALGEWHDPTKIHRRLLLDRRRIMFWLQSDAAKHLGERVRNHEIIDEVLGIQLSL